MENMTTRADDAYALAEFAHRGQVDKRGRDYVDHLVAVAAMLPDEFRAVALLHDVLEDTNLSPEAVRNVLSEDEFRAVLVLTRREGERYGSYIERIVLEQDEAGRIAREVKKADLRHNLSRTGPDLISLRRRYERALERLGGVRDDGDFTASALLAE